MKVDSYESTCRVYESSLRVEFTSRVYGALTSLRRLASLTTLLIPYRVNLVVDSVNSFKLVSLL